MTNRLILWWSCALLCFGTLAVAPSGCGTLDKSGVYAGDKVLYDADVAIGLSYDVIHNFVLWEFNNRAALAIQPGIKKSADRIRAEAPKWFSSAIALRDTYKANPTKENGQALESVLSVLHTAVAEATRYLALSATNPLP